MMGGWVFLVTRDRIQEGNELGGYQNSGDVEYVARLVNQAMFSFIRHDVRFVNDYFAN